MSTSHMANKAPETPAHRLAPDLTIAELPAFSCEVSPESLGQDVADALHGNAELPGVIVAEGARILGLISRAKFIESMSERFGPDLYLGRPVKLLIQHLPCRPLLLSGATVISEAAQAALRRPRAMMYEPIIVLSGETRKVLDFHTLLEAQTQLLAQAHEAVQKQKESAEAANQAKSQFLANMSHEIRTPLTAILGFTEQLLHEDIGEPERINSLRTIARNGEHLLGIINDILDLSKIEAGKLAVERLKFSPVQVAADVVSIMNVRAAAKGVDLCLKFISPIPESIQSDPTRLRQILINLVGNAIKFTEKGYVELQVAFDQTEPWRPLMRFSVIDTGIGMSKEQIHKIFEPFTQADGTTARKYGGTGLGLTISRRLTEMLGGEVKIESEVGQGTTFHVTIDVGDLIGVRMLDDLRLGVDRGTLPSQLQNLTDLSGVRILLAEDSPDNQALIVTILRRAGANVEISGNGEAAMNLATEAQQAQHPFDVVLMDMHMPVLDGYEATRRLRKSGYERPIIALTANAMEGDRAKCISAGCNDYAVKPIDRPRLLAQIAAQLPPEKRGHDGDKIAEETGENMQQSLESLQTASAEESSVPREEKSGTSEDDGHVSGDSVPSDKSAAIDVGLALQRCAGDEELLQEISQMFVDLCPKWLDELDAALGAEDFSELRRIAHTLKNSAQNIGAAQASESAHHVETLTACGELDKGEREDIKEAVARLRLSFEQLLPAVEKAALKREMTSAENATR